MENPTSKQSLYAVSFALLSTLSASVYAADVPTNKEAISHTTLDEKNISAEVTVMKLSPLLERLALNIEKQKYQAAYDLANSHVFHYEGDAQFDFYYGLSASRISKFDEAQMVFERLTGSYPDQQRYRLELARCYYYLADYQQSEKAFKQVLSDNPPYDVQVNIRQFLTLIEQQKRSISSHLIGGLDLQLGYDSNINSAANQDSLTLNNLPDNIAALFEALNQPAEITLQRTQKELASPYANTQGFVSWQHPFTKRSAMDVLLLASHRLNTESHDFDVSAAMLDSGYQRLTGRHLFRVGGSYSNFWLNSEKLQQQYGISGQWQMLLDQRWSLTSRFNMGRLDNQTNDSLDMNQGQLTVALNHAGKKWGHNLSTLLATDNSLKGKNSHQGKKSLGMTYKAQYALNDQWLYRATTGWRANRYNDNFPSSDLFNGGELRIENKFSIGLGTNYRVNKQLTAKLDLSHTRNNSNLTSYQYQRTYAQLGVSWLFN